MKTRKTFARFASLLLIAAMIFTAFAACKPKDGADQGSKEGKEEAKPTEVVLTDEEMILGKWTANVDVSTVMQKTLEKEQDGMDEMSTLILQNMDCSGLNFNMSFEFDKEGNFKGEVDEQSVNDMIKSLGKKLGEAIQKSDDGTFSAMLTMLNLSSWDEFGDMFAQEMTAGGMDFGSLGGKGTYKLENGKLIMTEENGSVATADYKLSKTQLEFVSLDAEGIDDSQKEMNEMLLPFVFKKN